jgi:hypothetical protein
MNTPLMYDHIWVDNAGVEHPCTVREANEDLVIRLEDPYDPGEIQITVPRNQVRPGPGLGLDEILDESWSWGSR